MTVLNVSHFRRSGSSGFLENQGDRQKVVHATFNKLLKYRDQFGNFSVLEIK